MREAERSTRSRLFLLLPILVISLAGCAEGAMPKGSYGTIFGTVTNTASRPIAGAQITVDFVIVTQTQADGTYRVPTVPIDASGTSTTVKVHAAGYLDQTAHPSVNENQQVQVDFKLSAG